MHPPRLVRRGGDARVVNHSSSIRFQWPIQTAPADARYYRRLGAPGSQACRRAASTAVQALCAAPPLSSRARRAGTRTSSSAAAGRGSAITRASWPTCSSQQGSTRGCRQPPPSPAQRPCLEGGAPPQGLALPLHCEQASGSRVKALVAAPGMAHTAAFDKILSRRRFGRLTAWALRRCMQSGADGAVPLLHCMVGRPRPAPVLRRSLRGCDRLAHISHV